MAGQLIQLGGQFRNLSRGDRRALAASAGAEGLGQLSQLLFAMANAREQRAQRQAELEYKQNAVNLPMLRLQAQLARYEKLDERHARERGEDLEHRDVQRRLSEQRDARQEQALGLVADRTAAYVKEKMPEAVAQRAAVTATATERARFAEQRKNDMARPLTLEEQKAFKLGAGATFGDAVKGGRYAMTEGAQKAQLQLSAKLAFLQRTREAVANAMIDPPPNAGAAQTLATLAKQFGTIKAKGITGGDPDAVFLSSLGGQLEKLKEPGTGAFSDDDRKAIGQLMPNPAYNTRQAGLEKIDNAINQALRAAKQHRFNMDEVLFDAEQHRANTFGGSVAGAAPAAPPAAPMPSATRQVRFPDGSIEEVSVTPTPEERRRLQQKLSAMPPTPTTTPPMGPPATGGLR